MEVYFHLGVNGGSIDGKSIFGQTGGPSRNNLGDIVFTSERGMNALDDVFIDNRVNITTIDNETKVYSLNHEAGCNTPQYSQTIIMK